MEERIPTQAQNPSLTTLPHPPGPQMGLVWLGLDGRGSWIDPGARGCTRFLGCCNEWPRTGWLKTTKVNSLTVLKLEIRSQGATSAMFHLRLGGGSALARLAPGGGRHPRRPSAAAGPLRPPLCCRRAFSLCVTVPPFDIPSPCLSPLFLRTPVTVR